MSNIIILYLIYFAVVTVPSTSGIDFQEFVAALNDNKIADSAKLAKLQDMSCNTVFSMDTLITAERRKQLFRSIGRYSFICDSIFAQFINIMFYFSL